MSAPKPTPRFVARIEASRAAAAGQPSSTPASSSPVFPIRPAESPVERAAPARRRLTTPVARRPWQILLVPATPGAPTRAFVVARWQARLLATLAGGMLLIAVAAVAAVVIAIENPDVVMPSEEAAVLRAQLHATQDSLTKLRAEDDAAETPSEIASVPKSLATPAPAAGRPATSRPAPAAALGVGRARLRPLGDLPVVGAIVSTFSFSRRHPILHIRRPHLGVDVAAPRGTPISVPADGRVVFVGRRFAFGLVVELDHGHGMVTRYAHLRSAAVEEGQQVSRGALLGAVGSSGLTTGPHLHYEVLVNGRQVDPLRAHLPGSTP